ncbi:hypothetical protein [Actinoplanes sp. NPDC051494]|uniref:hypothetical protein n=1 Tax=Actinoplanes sp. NPDC051494 TaxID=3363907 RepID=UPI0037A2BACA
MTNRALNDLAVANRALNDRAMSNRTLANRAMSNRTLANRAPGNRTLTNRAMSDRASANRALSSRALGSRALGNLTLSDRALHDRALGDRLVGGRGRGCRLRGGPEAVEFVLHGLDPVAGGAGGGGDLVAEVAAEGVHLGGDAVLDVHFVQDRVGADQHGRADEDDADRGEQYRETGRSGAAGDEHDEGRDRGEADAGPDQPGEQAWALLHLGVPVRHGG